MSPLLIIIVGSGTGAALLVLLFTIEGRRERRFAEGIRGRLDTIASAGAIRWHTLMLYIGRGSGRVGLHFLLHQFLRVGSVATAKLQRVLERWQRRNRRVARSVQVARAESHLTAIADYKHETALSDTQKAELKEKSLAG